MTFEEARALVARLSYRPGWVLTIREDWGTASGNAILTLCAYEPDVDSPAWDVSVAVLETLRADRLSRMDEKEFLQCVYDLFERRVQHEMREWLRLDGRPLVEPHPDRYSRGVLR